MYAMDPVAVLGSENLDAIDSDRLEEYKINSIEYLEALAADGRVDAMLSLSMAYKNSRYLPHDQVKSAAYRLAAEAVGGVEISAQPMSMTLKGLAASEQADAIAMARDIRSRCCLGQ